jgi:hypothetical protein
VAENAEKILCSLQAQKLLSRQLLEFILETAATHSPVKAYATLFRWAEQEQFGPGNVSRTAPARAARALAKLREKSELEFRRARDCLLALWQSKRPPP